MSTLTTETYATAVERVHDKYKDRIYSVLRSIQWTFAEQGWEARGVADWTDEQFSYAIYLTPPEPYSADQDNCHIDFRFDIAESMAYGDETAGISFAIDVTAYGGRCVGGLQPFNFTPEVWVDPTNAEAIEERFEIVESAEPREWYLLCADYIEDNQPK
jgi:hypothetical protein